jgi:hypothetical protein
MWCIIRIPDDANRSWVLMQQDTKLRYIVTEHVESVGLLGTALHSRGDISDTGSISRDMEIQ